MSRNVRKYKRKLREVGRFENGGMPGTSIREAQVNPTACERPPIGQSF